MQFGCKLTFRFKPLPMLQGQRVVFLKQQQCFECILQNIGVFFRLGGPITLQDWISQL